MFPGDSDPNLVGTGGVFVEPWSEITASNPPADRRFVMSMGPVSLEAGGKNDFTMAVLWRGPRKAAPRRPWKCCARPATKFSRSSILALIKLDAWMRRPSTLTQTQQSVCLGIVYV